MQRDGETARAVLMRQLSAALQRLPCLRHQQPA
jgi:hypothetical protein